MTRQPSRLADATRDRVEAHYRQSAFIREVCLAAGPDGLHAVVVPDADAMRRRRIVNIGELIRFEMEGLSILLAPHERVGRFDVRMDPLPRTAVGEVDRGGVAAWLAVRMSGRPAAPTHHGPPDDHLNRIVATVQELRPQVPVDADSNLELDLGLDSVERVELLAALEQRRGIRIPDDAASCALSVRDLAEAFRGAAPSPPAGAFRWDALLERLEPDAALRGLLKRRFFTTLLFFAVARVAVATLVRPRVTGLEHLPRGGGPLIITPNHQSYIDPFVLMGTLPLNVFRRLFFVGAAEYFDSRATAWLARRLNVVPVDPDANLLPALQAGAFGLRHGRVLVLFPEGERSIDGTVRKFKKGAAILARHAGAPIVPVAIHGVFEIWPRNRPLDWRRLLPWSRHRTRVAFGPPLAPPSPDTSFAAHTAALRSTVEELWGLSS